MIDQRYVPARPAECSTYPDYVKTADRYHECFGTREALNDSDNHIRSNLDAQNFLMVLSNRYYIGNMNSRNTAVVHQLNLTVVPTATVRKRLILNRIDRME